MFEVAVAYRNRGWAVIPVSHRGKKSQVSWKEYQHRLPTDEELSRWFSDGAVNIAVVTGRQSGLVVLDFDSEQALAAFEQEFGALPLTLSARSARGRHYYFAYPTTGDISNRTGFRDNVDVRADGGYVLAPPSVHETGAVYAWDDPDTPVADLPLAVMNALVKPDDALDAAPALVTEGKRNSTLTKAAGKLCRRVSDLAALKKELQELNQQRCNPPLEPDEVDRIAESVYMRARGPKRKIATTNLADVQPEQIDWVWHGYLARGHMTVIDGAPGLGKSLLAYDLIARMTTGQPWPDGSPGVEPQRVLLIRPEDHLASVVRPRLEAAGADLSLITVVGVDEDAVQFPRDFDAIRDVIYETRPGLVVIDPLTMVFGRGLDSNAAGDMVSVLGPWRQLAEDADFVQLTVRHTKKNTSTGALSAGAGSYAGNGIARAVFLVGEHPRNRNLRVLASTKTTLTAKLASRVFSIVDGGAAPTVQWGSTVPITADDLTTAPRRSDQLQLATDFLVEKLAAGEWMATNDAMRLAKEAGFAERTVWRAMTDAQFTRRDATVDGRSVKQISLTRSDEAPEVDEAIEG